MDCPDVESGPLLQIGRGGSVSTKISGRGQETTKHIQESHTQREATTIAESGLYPGPITLSRPKEMPQLVPSRKRDEDSGRFEEEYSPEEVIAAIQKHSGEAGTPDIAEEIGSSHGTARYKLRVMEEQGYVESRKISGVYIWKVADSYKEE